MHNTYISSTQKFINFVFQYSCTLSLFVMTLRPFILNVSDNVNSFFQNHYFVTKNRVNTELPSRKNNEQITQNPLKIWELSQESLQHVEFLVFSVSDIPAHIFKLKQLQLKQRRTPAVEAGV